MVVGTDSVVVVGCVVVRSTTVGTKTVSDSVTVV